MSSLEKIARAEPSGPSVFFRERAYAPVERQAFIRDILGLANALVDGPRYLILGVRDVGSVERVFVWLAEEEIAAAYKRYRAEISRFIEPALELDIQALEIDGAMVMVIALNDCEEPPYLLRENLSNAMREGSGWILRAKEPARLRRADLQELFRKTLLGSAHQPTIELGFAAKGLVEEITLGVLDLAELPSRIAGEKFRNLMEAKEASEDLSGGSATRIQRLVHAREFGGTAPFEKASDTALMRRLDAAPDEHWEADDYYQYETRAHKVNISVANIGNVELRGGLLTVDFPRVDGVEISEYVRLPPGSQSASPEGYPVVDNGENKTRIQTKIAVVPRHARIPAFAQPLRILVREEAAGCTLPVDYRLHAANLPEPLVGTLRVNIRTV